MICKFYLYTQYAFKMLYCFAYSIIKLPDDLEQNTSKYHTFITNAETTESIM